MMHFVRPCVRTATAVAVLLLAPVGSPSGTSAPTPSSPALRPVASATLQQQEDRYSARVLALVNQRRERHHLRALRPTTCVTGYATGWADTLARRNAFEHSDLGRLMSRCDSSYGAENIAKVPPSTTPGALVRLWMRSPDHRRNILSRHPSRTGVGIRWDADTGMWLAVQNFTRRPGS